MQHKFVCALGQSLRTLCLLGCLMTLSAPTKAHAHGRILRASGIAAGKHAWYQRTPVDWLVGLTFGTAVSHDQGQSFQWICDDAVGGVTNFDAIVAVPGDKTLVIANRSGLFVSRDGGCSFATDPLFAPPMQVSFVAVDPSDSAHWFVTANDVNKGQGTLHETADNGVHFKTVPLDNAHIYLASVAIRVQHPQDIVVAGTTARRMQGSPLWVSHDGGASFTQRLVQKAPIASASPRVALHPSRPGEMLAAWLDALNNTAYVLRSTDDGATFDVVVHPQEPVNAVVYPDGGDAAWVSGLYHLFVSADAGRTFAQQPHPDGNACLAVSGGRVLTCGAEGRDGYSAASRSLPGLLNLNGLAGGDWQPALRLNKLQGPFHCQEGTPVYDLCSPLWPSWAQRLGAMAAPPAQP